MQKIIFGSANHLNLQVNSWMQMIIIFLFLNYKNKDCKNQLLQSMQKQALMLKQFLLAKELILIQIRIYRNYIYQNNRKMQSNKETSTDDSELDVIEELVRRYVKKKFLGKGGFAKVYQIQNLENKKNAAIKIVLKQTLKKSKAKQKLITEIKIHKSLIHRNIVHFDHVFEDSENVYMVLQLCSNHTLNEMMKKRKRICELQLQYYLYHIIQGLLYIHSQKVIHRDLKLGNIMINQDMEIKIGDFGLAAKLQSQGEKRRTICGTPNYLAPEVVNNSGHSYEVDIWSLGVIMYTLLYGRPPFETSDVKKTYKRIKECQYTFNDSISVSFNAKNLISKALVLDPSKRITLDQILSHPFMTNNKMPKKLPTSILSEPLSKQFVDQYTFNSQNHSVGKYNSNNIPKNIQQKPQMDFERPQSQKGVSSRLLLRTSPGLNRNLLYNKQNQKDELYQLKSNPQLLLSNNYFKPESAKGNIRQGLNGVNSIYVKKWVDYSSKYGLGYLLSDGTTGIYFNDSTKMIIDQAGQKVDYINNELDPTKRLVSFCNSDNISDKELNKKLTLMQYFRKYLQSGGEEVKQKKDKLPFVYIKKWVKSDQAILFRLNNKVIQVNFNDKSQIILYTEKDMILYSNNTAKEKQVLEINSPEIKKNVELFQRVQHVKLMLRKCSIKSGGCEDGSQKAVPLQLQIN